MTRPKKTTIWLALLGILVLCLCWQVYRQHTSHRQLSGFLQSLIAEADYYEAMRNLSSGASPSVTAQCLRNIVKWNDVVRATQIEQGFDAAKVLKSAPQETQYYVTHLQATVARVKAVAISDLIRALRAQTAQDLGDDPVKWMQRYADKN